jgi:hypothetical protein
VARIPYRKRKQDFEDYWAKWDAHANYTDDGDGDHWRDKDHDEELSTFLLNYTDAKYMEKVEDERSGAADKRREEQRLKMERIKHQIALRRAWEKKRPNVPDPYAGLPELLEGVACPRRSRVGSDDGISQRQRDRGSLESCARHE